MATLTSFTGRSRLHLDDHVVYWSVYGLLEILETKHAEKTDLIKNCKDFLESIHKFIKERDFSAPHPHVEELLILPYLKNEHFKNGFEHEIAV
jgi:hypothetical protein